MSFIISAISEKLELPYDETRLVFSMVVSVSLALINHLLINVKVRLIYNLIIGLVLQYVGYGITGILNISSSAIITYLFMKYFGRKVSAFVILFYTLFHLAALNIYRKYLCELSWTISFSDTIYMMTLVKYSSMAFSYEDGEKEDKELKNQHLIDHKIVELPSLLEVMSFVYFYPTSIIGPGFEFKDFKDWIELKGHYKTMTPKIAIYEGIKRLIFFIFLTVLYSYVSNAFPLPALYSDSFGKRNIFYKIYYVFFSAAGYRTKFYSGFNSVFMAMIFTGLSYQEVREKKTNEETDKSKESKNVPYIMDIGHFGNALIIEFGLNPRDKIANWNRTVHLWLKYNVYIRIIRLNIPFFKGNAVVASFCTFIVSAFWHGFYITFYLFFSLFFLLNTASERFEKKGFYNYVNNSNILIKVLAWFFIQLMVNGLVIIFANLHFEKFLLFMNNFYWLPIFMVGVVFLGSLFIHTGGNTKIGEKKLK
ncbi:MAG: hypothetical protein MJ252_06080 [archaeon]|nr:hypothetical protein [archaeon]